jgi:hypothetical protein
MSLSGTPASGDNYGLRTEESQLPRSHLEGNDALTGTVDSDDIGGVVLVITFDGRVLQRRLKQGVEEMKPGLVRRIPGTLYFHAAERTHSHVAVCLAAPGAAPMFDSG